MRKLFLFLLLIFAVVLFINSNARAGAERPVTVESSAKAAAP